MAASASLDAARSCVASASWISPSDAETEDASDSRSRLRRFFSFFCFLCSFLSCFLAAFFSFFFSFEVLSFLAHSFLSIFFSDLHS